MFLDADGASEIKDMMQLEKALDTISSNHVRLHAMVHGGSFIPHACCVMQMDPAITVGSRAHLQDEAVAQVALFSGCHSLVHHTYFFLAFVFPKFFDVRISCTGVHIVCARDQGYSVWV